MQNLSEDKIIPQRRRSPLVLLGGAITAGILFSGIYQFYKGNSINSQRLMRARVAAQGVTVLLMLGTSGYFATQS